MTTRVTISAVEGRRLLTIGTMIRFREPDHRWWSNVFAALMGTSPPTRDALYVVVSVVSTNSVTMDIEPYRKP